MVGACARKLLTILNTMLRDNTCYPSAETFSRQGVRQVLHGGGRILTRRSITTALTSSLPRRRHGALTLLVTLVIAGTIKLPA